MGCNYKKIAAGILAAAMIMSNSTTIQSVASGGSPGGSGELEGVLSDVFNVVVPTEANRPADANQIYTSAFDFILDPKGLASTGTLAGKNLEPNATVYFENLEQGSPYEHSSTSDGFTVINKGMVDVDVTLEASLTGMDGVRLTSDKNFTDDKSASVYLALTDSKGKVSAVDKFGAAVKSTLKGQPRAYKAIYNHSTGKYEYQLRSDADLQKDNIKFIDYTFRLTGACNSANSWMKLSGYLEPEITVTWRVAPRPQNLAPSILKTSYVMNDGKSVLIDVDLGEGTLAATGIRTITYTSSSGTVSTLATGNYTFADGILKFRAAYISSVLDEGVSSRDYTIIFNDKAGTQKVVKLVPNDDLAPSIAQAEYEMVSGKPVIVDVDLGAGSLAATNIKSITYVNAAGETKTLSAEHYTLVNGELKFKDSYIDIMFNKGVTSREHTITFNDKASTQVSVMLKADGDAPSIIDDEYTFEKGKAISVPVNLGSGALEAKGIKYITFVNISGVTTTLSTEHYTYANGEVIFKDSYVDLMLGKGIISRKHTIVFDNAAGTSAVITLVAADEAPSIDQTEYSMVSGQPVRAKINMGSGTLGATGIKSITYANVNGEIKTLSTDHYTFTNGELKFKAAYIDIMLDKGVLSRKHTLVLNDAAGTTMEVTLAVEGDAPSIGTTSAMMERGKPIEIEVDLGSEDMAASGIASISFVNVSGVTTTLSTEHYTFANGKLTFKDSYIAIMLDKGIISREHTITFNNATKTKASLTLSAPNVVPSVNAKPYYVMTKGQPIRVEIDLGSGSDGATGIESITYEKNGVIKTVPTTYYAIESGVLKFTAAYINGVVDAGITSREYTITFNDKARTQEIITFQM